MLVQSLFDVPTQLQGPPTDQVPRSSSELIVTIVVGVVWLGCMGYSIRSWLRHRDIRGVLLTLGGAIATLQEPVVDVLGYVWVRSDLTVFETFGREMPLWAILAYSVYWGFQPYVLVQMAERGMTLRTFRICVAACFALNLLLEWPVLQTDVYTYYGNPPFEVLGFPLHWLFINGAGVVGSATVAATRPQWFRGWRVGYLLLVPVIVTPAMSLASGLPVFSALQSQAGTSAVITWIASIVTMVIAFVIIDIGGRALCAVGKPTSLGRRSGSRSEASTVTSASREVERSL
jgi:hypothetical protein